MHNRRQLISILVLLAVVAVTFFLWHENVKPLPFNASLWKMSDAKMRFRMKDSLVALYRIGKISTRSDVDALLGHDDENDAPNRRLFGLEDWNGNPWYMSVRFDDQGKIIDMRAQPS